MRDRKEIENSEIGRSGTTIYGTPKETLILEVLLDIREQQIYNGEVLRDVVEILKTKPCQKL